MLKVFIGLSSTLMFLGSFVKMTYDCRHNLLVNLDLFLGKVSYLESFKLYEYHWYMFWDTLLLLFCFFIFIAGTMYAFDALDN